MYMGLHVKYLLFFSRNPRNIKFHENSSSGSALFRADKQTDGQTDTTGLIVAFGNFANAPKNGIGHGGRKLESTFLVLSIILRSQNMGVYAMFNYNCK